MAEFPALPLWTDAYLGDTTHLTTIEHGAYLLLLIAAWRSGDTRLPDDDKKLARYARLTPGQWARIKPTILDFFHVADGWWTQRRLTDEAVAVRQKRQAQSDNGRASALKRKGRHSAERPTKPQSSDQPDANQPATPISTPSSVSKDTGAAAPIDDPVKALIDTGIALLVAAEVPGSRARSIIGKWRRDHGDAQTLAAIVAARDGGITQPVEWITARFRSAGEQEDEALAISRATAERYRRMDMPGPPRAAAGEGR
jgi:uncharacterized protein YdaU (DUF1376 family)